MLDELNPKVDRFKFEEQLMQCWKVVDDINVIYKQFDYSDLSQDEIQNALLGLVTIYEMKFQQMFDTFEKLIQQRKIQ